MMRMLSFLLSLLVVMAIWGCSSTTSSSVVPSKHVVKVKKEYYTGGMLRSEFFMYDKSGMNGLRKSYGFDGELMSEVEVKNGVKHGKEINYDNKGRVRMVKPYVNGRIDGVATVYYENSTPKMTITYVKGLKHGPAKKYNSNGSLFEKVTFKNNRKVK